MKGRANCVEFYQLLFTTLIVSCQTVEKMNGYQEILKSYCLALMKERMDCCIIRCTFCKYSKLICGMFSEKSAPKIFLVDHCSSWSCIPHACFEINCSQCLSSLRIFHYLLQIHSIMLLGRKLVNCRSVYGSVILLYTRNCIKVFVPFIFS